MSNTIDIMMMTNQKPFDFKESDKMNKEQIRKEIVYEVMKELKYKSTIAQYQLREIRKILNSKITKVLNEIK